ncbi:MAG: hypothetical protein ACR2K5_14205 [Pseudolabrys sp.]
MIALFASPALRYGLALKIVMTASIRARLRRAHLRSFRSRWDRSSSSCTRGVGGPAAASVAVHVQAPLIGLGLGFVAVHYLAIPLGVWWSYLIALAIGIAWNALLWLACRRSGK